MPMNYVSDKTLVLTDSGWSCISRVAWLSDKRYTRRYRPANLVSYDPSKKLFVTQPARFKRLRFRLTVVTMLENGAEIEALPETSFYIKDYGFKRVRFIKIGDELLYMHPDRRIEFFRVTIKREYRKRNHYAVLFTKQPRSFLGNGLLVKANFLWGTEQHRSIIGREAKEL